METEENVAVTQTTDTAEPAPLQRLNRALGPVAAGLIIDLMDLSTFGSMGLVMGIPIGGLAGYWMGSALALPRKQALLCAVAAGLYCMMPFTEFIPLATLVGALVRFQETGRTRAALPPPPVKTPDPQPEPSVDESQQPR